MTSVIMMILWLIFMIKNSDNDTATTNTPKIVPKLMEPIKTPHYNTNTNETTN